MCSHQNKRIVPIFIYLFCDTLISCVSNTITIYNVVTSITDESIIDKQHIPYDLLQ